MSDKISKHYTYFSKDGEFKISLVNDVVIVKYTNDEKIISEFTANHEKMTELSGNLINFSPENFYELVVLCFSKNRYEFIFSKDRSKIAINFDVCLIKNYTCEFVLDFKTIGTKISFLEDKLKLIKKELEDLKIENSKLKFNKDLEDFLKFYSISNLVSLVKNERTAIFEKELYHGASVFKNLNDIQTIAVLSELCYRDINFNHKWNSLTFEVRKTIADKVDEVLKNN